MPQQVLLLQSPPHPNSPPAQPLESWQGNPSRASGRSPEPGSRSEPPLASEAQPAAPAPAPSALLAPLPDTPQSPSAAPMQPPAKPAIDRISSRFSCTFLCVIHFGPALPLRMQPRSRKMSQTPQFRAHRSRESAQFRPKTACTGTTPAHHHPIPRPYNND